MAPRNDECEKAIKFISNGIKNCTEPESFERWCESARTEAGYDKSAHSFHFVIRSRLDRIEHLKGYSLMEKARLVFIFSRPVSDVFVKELESNKCVVELNDKRKITYFRSPDGDCVLQSEQVFNPSKRKFKGEPILKKKRKAVAEVTSLDNVQDPPDTPANNQKQESKATEMKKEKNKNTSTKQKSILNTEEDVDVMNGSLQQEPSFNGRIDYDDLDNGEHPEFMVPVGYQLLDKQNKRHPEPSQENAKRLKIEKSRESGLVDSPEINDVEMRSGEVEEAQELEQSSEVSNEPTCRVNNESEIQNQVAPVGNQSIDKNHAQNLVQITQNRVKIEDFLEEMQREQELIILDEKPEMPPPATISLLKLAEQIETYAFNIVLDESFQQKTAKAVRMFKANDKTILIQEFNLLFNGMLAGLKRERIENSNKNSIQLIRLFKQLRRNLIGPMGEEIGKYSSALILSAIYSSAILAHLL